MDANLIVTLKPPPPHNNPNRYFLFIFLIISLIFIENKCLYDVIRDLKRWGGGGVAARQKAGRSRQKDHARAAPSTPLELMSYSRFYNVVSQVDGWSQCKQPLPTRQAKINPKLKNARWDGR